MGGTFNPVHKGHIQIAVKAHEQYNIPSILFMPSGTPAHKDNSNVISATHRCNMVKLAIKDYDYMKLSTLEIDRGGNTYTADTLEELKNNYDLIYFIIGADSLLYLDRWYKPDYICANCVILCANRDNHSLEELIEKKEYLHEKFNADIRFIKCDNIPFSSTQIRDAASKYQNLTEYVGSEVSKYIKDNNLYEQ